VGAFMKIPVVLEVDVNDSIAVRSIMALTLAHDHRLIDGMLGSLFLKYVKDTLEGFDPTVM
jgi:pyruvate/2-oxoglutarate dehydrogenase complex dihydrolipoamide acyltransferase (E2) component